MAYTVVPIETVVTWRVSNKTLRSTLNAIQEEIDKNYKPSTKFNKLHRRRCNSTHPLYLDESLGIRIASNGCSDNDTIIKAILMALNKVSLENAGEVFTELQRIRINSIETLEKIANIVFKKTLHEHAFRSQYLDIVEQLDWYFVSEDDYIYGIKELYVIEVQKEFERIKDISKDEGCRLMEVLACIYVKGWVDASIFEVILKLMIDSPGNIPTEYAITFLKGCPSYHEKNLIKSIIMNKPSLPMRLRMLLE